jgi:hypothetical protein
LKVASTIALVVLVALTGIALSTHQHIVWQRDTTYLMWSSDRTYLFSNRLSDGWSGNHFGLGWQMARGAVGLATEMTHRREWLEVIELAPDGLVRSIVPSSASIAPFVSGGQVFAVHQGSLSRWENGAFHPVPLDEVPNIRREHGGEFTNAQGWSSLYNIDNRGEGDRTYQLHTQGVTVAISVKQTTNRRTMLAQFPGKPQQVLVDLPSGPVWVDEATYVRMLEVPSGR